MADVEHKRGMSHCFCNKCGFSGVPINDFGEHRRPSDDELCNYFASAHPQAPAAEIGGEVTQADIGMDPEAIREHARRIYERMTQTPHGPKRTMLANQHAALLEKATYAEGWNAALATPAPERPTDPAIAALRAQLAERDRELEEARAEAAIERSVGQQQLEALDGALRIALWNECRGRGMSQDASLLHIRDRMSAFLDSKEKNDG